MEPNQDDNKESESKQAGRWTKEEHALFIKGTGWDIQALHYTAKIGGRWRRSWKVVRVLKYVRMLKSSSTSCNEWKLNDRARVAIRNPTQMNSQVVILLDSRVKIGRLEQRDAG